MLELTVAGEINVVEGNERKRTKYQELVKEFKKRAAYQS